MAIWKQRVVILIVLLRQNYSWCTSRKAHPAVTATNMAI